MPQYVVYRIKSQSNKPVMLGQLSTTARFLPGQKIMVRKTVSDILEMVHKDNLEKICEEHCDKSILGSDYKLVQEPISTAPAPEQIEEQKPQHILIAKRNKSMADKIRRRSKPV